MIHGVAIGNRVQSALGQQTMALIETYIALLLATGSSKSALGQQIMARYDRNIPRGSSENSIGNRVEPYSAKSLGLTTLQRYAPV